MPANVVFSEQKHAHANRKCLNFSRFLFKKQKNLMHTENSFVVNAFTHTRALTHLRITHTRTHKVVANTHTMVLWDGTFWKVPHEAHPLSRSRSLSGLHSKPEDRLETGQSREVT